jgi:hypothetical protein
MLSADLTFDQLPVCLADMADFESECGNAAPSQEKRSEVVNRERECDKFTPWRVGFSPVEHYQMILAEQRDKADREWRHKEAEQQRQWQSGQATAAQTRHRENLDAVSAQLKTLREGIANDNAFYRKYLRVMWAGIVAGIISGALSGWLSSRASHTDPVTETKAK